jgi:hypothetical protein
VVAARGQKQREGWSHRYHCPSHPEGHFGSYSLLKCREVLWGNGERGGVLVPSLATRCNTLQALPPIPTFSSRPPKAPKHQPSLSCTCGQVSYEHQYIYTLPFMEEGKPVWGRSLGRGSMLPHRDHALPMENQLNWRISMTTLRTQCTLAPNHLHGSFFCPGPTRKQSQIYVLCPIPKTDRPKRRDRAEESRGLSDGWGRVLIHRREQF